MIGEFYLENIRSFWGRHEAPIGKITLIYGPNSHGKSTLLRSFVRHSWACSDEDLQKVFGAVPVLQCDGFLSSLPGQNPDLELVTGFRATGDLELADLARGLELRYSLEPEADPGLPGRLIGGAILSRSADIPFGANVPDHLVGGMSRALGAMATFPESASDAMEHFVTTLKAVDGTEDAIRENLRVLMGSENGSPYRDMFSQLQNAFGEGFVDAVVSTLDVGLSDDLISIVQKGQLDPGLDPRVRVASQLFSSLGKTYFDYALQSVQYIGPSRRQPTSVFDYDYREGASDGEPVDLGLRYENRLASAFRGGGISAINDGLRRLEVPYELSVDMVDLGVCGTKIRAVIVDKNGGFKLPLSSVGYGISQILPIVISLCTSGGTYCIEQPELHLHPRMQANLADFFATTSFTTPAGGKPVRPNLVIETHSESLITRLQRRIREGVVDPHDVVVLYVGQIEGRGSVIERLRIDDDGDFIDEWPGGFFEDGFDDVFGRSR